MSDDAGQLSFDVAAAASLYSQLSGVLAGFAFAALLVFLVSSSGSTSAPSEGAAVATSLICALVALIICALLFAILAAEPAGSGRASYGLMVYGLPFGLSILSLFQALGLLMLSVDSLRGALKATQIALSIVGTTLIMGFLASASFDITQLRCGASCTADPKIGLVSPLTLGALLAFCLPMLSWYGRVNPRLQFVRRNGLALGPKITLVVAVVCALFSVAIHVQGKAWMPSERLVYITLAGAFLLLLLHAVVAGQALTVSPQSINSRTVSGERKPVKGSGEPSDSGANSPV
jgi:hypothetical protein